MAFEIHSALHLRKGNLVNMTADSGLSLQQSYAFRNVGPEGLEGLERLCRSSETSSLKSGEYLYRQYDPPKNVFFVQQGEYMAELDCADGSRQVYVFGGAGELLGFPVLDNYAYSVKSLTFVQTLSIAQDEFWKIVRDYSSLRRNLRKRGSQVLMSMSRQSAINGKLKAHERVGVMLGDISEIQQSERQVQLNMTRQDIADFLQLNSDSVSRAFRHLEEQGIICTDETGRTVDILQLQTIQDLVARI